MNDFALESMFFGVFLSLICYFIGMLLKKKLKLAIFNPLLIAIILVIIFLVIFKVDYTTYEQGSKYLSYFLTPATVALAITLYEQITLLKKNWLAICVGISSGVLTSLVSIFILAKIFSLSHEEFVTLLPKSITTAIGMDVSSILGGYVTITVAVIIITGILGAIIAPLVFKIFRITDPIAQGIALGTSAHAIGTSKAIELGEIQGAISGLSIAVSGILTVILASFFALLI